MQRHNVFVSYHHQNDQYYREEFEKLFNNIYDVMVSKSVQIGDIDPNLPSERVRQIIRDKYLRDSTVTVVLIGSETWKRKHIDWEIAASIRNTQYNSRSGLLGIILPSYHSNYRIENGQYKKSFIPPRLSDNIDCGFAKIYEWNTNPLIVQEWIHNAFNNRNKVIPDNSYTNFVNNRTSYGWC